jgi:hypothetical protein
MLSNWRKQLGAADRVAFAPKRRGQKPGASARQVLLLTREIDRLRRKLARADLIIDAQKKLCVALGLPTSDDRVCVSRPSPTPPNGPAVRTASAATAPVGTLEC